MFFSVQKPASSFFYDLFGKHGAKFYSFACAEYFTMSKYQENKVSGQHSAISNWHQQIFKINSAFAVIREIWIN